jgi:hypothetical protein
MALSSSAIGRISELQAVIKAIQNEYATAEPMFPEPYDLLISKDKRHWLKAQTKTLYYRADRNSYVVYAKKGNKEKYNEEEVDVFLAVLDNVVYMIPNQGKKEMWSKNPDTKWERL